MRTFAVTLSVVFALSALSCAGLDTRLPDISGEAITAERSVQETLAFDTLETHQDRLFRIATPILRDNHALCPKERQDIGVRTHSLSDYSKPVRDMAARRLNAQDTPTIAWVAPNSEAAKAGIMPSDALIGPKGKAVGAGHKRFLKSLGAPGDGPVTVQIKSGSQTRSVKLTPKSICGYTVKLQTSSAINAYADGRNITVTTGMLNFVRSDDELALVIGHELAHNTMGHVPKIIKNYLISGFATRYTRPFESEADYVGLYYMVRAGFNPSNVEDVWRRMGEMNPKSMARAKTHPATPDRYLRIAAARREIQAKQAAKLPLIPNFLSGEEP